MLHEVRFSLKDVCEWLSLAVLQGSNKILFNGVATDSRINCDGLLFFGLLGEKVDGGKFYREAFKNGARGAVVNAKVIEGEENQSSEIHLVNGKPLIIVNDTRNALKRCAQGYLKKLKKVRVVAITGSCGKTTTKEMVHTILTKRYKTVKAVESYNNLIGVSLTILSAPLDTEVLVLEFGTSAPGEIGLLCDVAQPDVSVLVAVGEAHLEGLGSLEGVFREKTTIVKKTKKGGVTVLNGDGLDVKRVEVPEGVRKIVVSAKSSDATVFAEDVHREGGSVRFKVGQLEGRLNTGAVHLVSNGLCAVAVADVFGISRESSLKSLSEFSPAKMRMEERFVDGVRLINDAYNANFISVCAAVKHLSGLSEQKRRIFVFGDMLELGEYSERLHEEVGRQVGESNIDVMVSVGRMSRIAADVASRYGFKKVYKFDNAEEAAQFLNGFVSEGDVVLAKGSRKIQLDTLITSFSCRKNRRREDGVA
ncbi:MAG: UDP-N-acetylmuramoyl-tripeptide--D-alanyl-D-alanine ligase [Planctomycetota bacterium]|nr:UDP-N-acetylmuramoyl-tripeptide--D-alanyl-D-alanine ligase [Planctomycetota bacterium]